MARDCSSIVCAVCVRGVVQDAWVLLYPEGMVTLNTPAAEILRRCDGSHSVAEIVGELEQAFARSPLRDDVHAFLLQADERGWLWQEA